MSIKCWDCNCSPNECKISPSAKDCPNCSFEECCCWKTINENSYSNSGDRNYMSGDVGISYAIGPKLGFWY